MNIKLLVVTFVAALLLTSCFGSDSEGESTACTTEGATRCVNTTIQRCTASLWTDYTNCEINSQQCGMNGGVAMCYLSTTSDSDSTSIVIWDTSGAPPVDSASSSDSVQNGTDNVSDTTADTSSQQIPVETDADSDGIRDTAVDTSSQQPVDTDADSDGIRDTAIDTSSQQLPVDTSSSSEIVTDTGSDTVVVEERTALFDIMTGGYVYAGDWHGYAWTSPGEVTGSTISPVDYSATLNSAIQLCVNGYLALDYDSVGILGLNVNQMFDDPLEGSWTPGAQHSGIFVNITNMEGSDVRLQIQDVNGNVYCAPITAGGETVLWSELREECWDSGGAQYNGVTPLTNAMLLIPGDEDERVTFNVCLNDMYPVGSAWPPVEDTDTVIDTGSSVDTDTGTGTAQDTSVPTDVDTTVDTLPAEDVVCGTAFEIHPSGYLCAAPWQGYAWTSAGDVSGATITPTSYSNYTGTETEICAAGSLAEDYSSVGMLGMTLNQMSSSEEDFPWTGAASYTGVYVDVNNIDNSVLRLYLETTAGDTYCTTISEGGDTIPWSDFREECWEAGGDSYNGTDPLRVAILLVPGDEDRTVSFDMCLREIRPVTAAMSCSANQWMCDDGTCIPESYYCDQYLDCSGGEDEECW